MFPESSRCAEENILLMSGVIGRNGGRPVGEPREATGNSNPRRLQPEYAEGGPNTVDGERTHPFEG